MKKVLLSTLIMIAGLFMLAARARAQTGSVTVHIEHEFVAATKVFPAGTYKVYPASSDTGLTLILRSEEPGKSVFLLPSTYDSASAGPLEVKLRHAGDTYFLSEVVTDLGVYTFTEPRTTMRTAKGKDQGAGTIASSGNN